MHDLFAPDPDDSIVAIPVPVRPGVTAYLNLPRRLSVVEAERLAAIVRALAVED